MTQDTHRLESKIDKLDDKLTLTNNQIHEIKEQHLELTHGLKTYFTGVVPETHVYHHKDIIEKNEDMKDTRRIFKNMIGSLVMMLIVNVAGMLWLFTGIDDKLTNNEKKIDSLARPQVQPEPPKEESIKPPLAP